MTAEERLRVYAERIHLQDEDVAYVLLLFREVAATERSLWKRKILDADEQAETQNEKGEALMRLAEEIRRGQS